MDTKGLLRLGFFAALLYGAYKTGQAIEKNKAKKNPPLIFEEEVDFSTTNEEELYVENLIKELQSKKFKTKKDKYNIDLLLLKLEQLRKNNM